MKYYYTLLIASLLLSACGGGDKKTETKAKPVSMYTPPQTVASMEEDFQQYKGVGPVTSVTISDQIDQTMADGGKVIFEAKCTACHKIEKKFIGPSPKGILERRTPEWVMNMILNPDEMVQKDALAKQLLIENNGSPMANQNLSEADARAVLEYFRTL
ncbi:MAG: cytochrome c [Reichenbachiella sp.]